MAGAGWKEIPLSQGYVALVDEEDYARLSRFAWHADVRARQVYAARMDGPTPKFMHREIMAPPPGVEIDHVHHQEGNVVDNRRQNLRFASKSNNGRNQRKQIGRSSVFKGAYLHKASGRWQASIRTGRESRVFLGNFKVEVHAAYAYDLAAVRLFGDFALTNFPVPGSQRWLFGEVA